MKRDFPTPELPRMAMFTYFSYWEFVRNSGTG